MGLGLLLSAAAIAGHRAYGRLLTSPRLAVREVRFEGSHRTRPELLGSLRDELIGRNLLALDLGAIALRLRSAEPWIRSATVRRIFPNRILVTLTEHRAVAILGAGGELLSEEGRPLPATPALPEDRKLPRVEADRETGPGDAAHVALLRAVELVTLLDRGRQPLASRVAGIDARDPDDLVVRLKDASFAIHLGSTDFVSRLNRFRNVEPLLRSRYGSLERVDLRFRERVVVAPVPGRPATTGG